MPSWRVSQLVGLKMVSKCRALISLYCTRVSRKANSVPGSVHHRAGTRIPGYFSQAYNVLEILIYFYKINPIQNVKLRKQSLIMPTINSNDTCIKIRTFLEKLPGMLLYLSNASLILHAHGNQNWDFHNRTGYNAILYIQ